MEQAAVIHFLRALGARSITPGSRWVQASCPLAPWTHQSGKDAHPSFAVQVVDDKESAYNCFSCGGGDLISLVHRLHDYGAGPPKYDLKTAMDLAVADGERPLKFKVKEWGEPAESEPYITFPEPWLATFTHAVDSPRAMKYLTRKRRLPVSVIRALDIRYDTERDTVCFPIRDFDGVLCGLRGRYIAPTDDQPRYHMYANAKGLRNNMVWYGESWLEFDKPVVLCESVFDLASIYRVYSNVGAPLSASFREEKARRLKQAIEIVTMFDADKAGDKARQRVDKYFRSARVEHLYLPEGTDPGEATTALLREVIGNRLKLKREDA
jgi:Toprim-like